MPTATVPTVPAATATGPPAPVPTAPVATAPGPPVPVPPGSAAGRAAQQRASAVHFPPAAAATTETASGTPPPGSAIARATRAPTPGAAVSARVRSALERAAGDQPTQQQTTWGPARVTRAGARALGGSEDQGATQPVFGVVNPQQPGGRAPSLRQRVKNYESACRVAEIRASLQARQGPSDSPTVGRRANPRRGGNKILGTQPSSPLPSILRVLPSIQNNGRVRGRAKTVLRLRFEGRAGGGNRDGAGDGDGDGDDDGDEDEEDEGEDEADEGEDEADEGEEEVVVESEILE